MQHEKAAWGNNIDGDKHVRILILLIQINLFLTENLQHN